MFKSNRIRRLYGSVLVGTFLFFLSAPAFCDDEGPVAFQVKVVLDSGSEFDAVVKDKGIVNYLEKHDSLDLSKPDPKARLTLYYMYGMSGTTTVNLKDLKSVKRLLPLPSEELEKIEDAINKRVEQVRAKDKVRQAQVAKKRELEKKQVAESAIKKHEAEAILTQQKTEQAKIKWVLRFPPEQGWGPEKKEELYKRSMVVGVFPNEEEQTFLDNYNEWLRQFEVWKVMEEKKKAEEEKKKVEEEKRKEEKEKSVAGKIKNG